MSVRLPKGEIVCVSYFNKQHELLYIMTVKQMADYYCLYEVVDGGLVRLGKGKSPTDLENKFSVCDKIHR